MGRTPLPPTKERPRDWEFPVVGAQHTRRLAELVRGLREAEPHGHRRLLLDDVFVAHRLAFFNSCMRSLRKLDDFSQTRQAARRPTAPRLSRSCADGVGRSNCSSAG